MNKVIGAVAVCAAALLGGACSGGGASNGAGGRGGSGAPGGSGGSGAPGGMGGAGAKPTAAVTELGAPMGQVASQTIAADGGSLVSADGRLKVTIPPGALGAATPISITAISNFAPGGVGAAYRLEPSGTTFAQPVELALTFTDDDVAGSSPELLAWAFQDGMKMWHQLPATVDATAKVTRVSTNHFSDWSAVLGWRLLPVSANVKLNEALTLQLQYCATVDVPGDLSTLLGKCDPADGAMVSGWSVNSIPGGNATVGTVAAQGAVAIYTAPGMKPAANPVRVSVEAPAGKGKTLLFSNLQIISGAVKWAATTTFMPMADPRPDAVVWSSVATAELHSKALGGPGPGPAFTGTVTVTRLPPAQAKPTDCVATVDPPTQIVALTDTNTTGGLVISDMLPFYSGTVVTQFTYSKTVTCPNQAPITTQEGDPMSWLVIAMAPRTPTDISLMGMTTDPDNGSMWTWTLLEREE